MKLSHLQAMGIKARLMVGADSFQMFRRPTLKPVGRQLVLKSYMEMIGIGHDPSMSQSLGLTAWSFGSFLHHSLVYFQSSFR